MCEPTSSLLACSKTTTVLYMHLPTQNLLAWEGALFHFLQIQHLLTLSAHRKVSVTLFHLLAVGSTLLRLVHRWKTKRMWWDDYITVIPFTVDIVHIILMWLRFRDGGKHTHSSPSKSNECFLAAGVTFLAAGVTKPRFIYSTWFAAAISWTVIW
jgi:hypothetical protein